MMVAGLCVTIRHQVNEFERLSALRFSSFFSSKHIVPNGSVKVVTKQLRLNLSLSPIV